MYELPFSRTPADLRKATPQGNYPAPMGPGYSSHMHGGGDNLHWKRVTRTLEKRWPIVAAVVVVCMALLAVVVFSLKNTYEATARIEILPPAAPEAISLNQQQAPEAATTQDDYFQTQLEILQGDALAYDVVKQLHLDQNPEIGGGSHSVISTVKSWVGLPGSAPPGMEGVVRNFEKRVNINRVHNSQVVEISFASRSPQLSEQVTNALVNDYLKQSRLSQYNATMAAAGAISDKLNALKTDVDDANKKLVSFQRTNGIVDTTGYTTAAGGQQAGGAQNPISGRVMQLNDELTKAEAERLNEESYLRMIYAHNTNSLPQMHDNVVLQTLEQQLATNRANLAQALAIYGENNPNVKQLRSQTDELQVQVDQQRQGVLSQVKTAYDAAQAHETLVRNELAQLKGSLDRADQSMVEYRLLKEDADAKSNLYVTLRARLNEIAISSSLFANNIRILDNARVPEKPASPKRMELMLAGFLFSLIAGTALALVRENFDDTVNTMDDVREWSGLPCLGIVPRIGGGRASLPADTRNLLGSRPNKPVPVGARSRFFIDRPGSPEAEAMHSLDTSIRLPVRTEADPRQVLVIASSFPSEGKTTIAMNLAMALSRHGATCLVDADLRNPQVGRAFSITSQKGLRDLLSGATRLEDVLQPAPRLDKLMILPAGSTPPDPVELLASPKMRDVMAQLRNKFTYVVIDSPPVVPYADSRWLACLADGVVLVARSGATTRQAMSLSAEILKELRAPVLGVVLNGVDLKSEYYWYGYGYDGKRKTA
ncbi:MAG TPA: polysaccharide biosynthesis tyrosine autokinase [Candidatus Acidoferrales bacterium]|nr:polysaccharide biosynthesis tyrosine autokinase [Candidatus Acidoferrales bacterium]